MKYVDMAHHSHQAS